MRVHGQALLLGVEGTRPSRSPPLCRQLWRWLRWKPRTQGPATPTPHGPPTTSNPIGGQPSAGQPCKARPLRPHWARQPPLPAWRSPARARRNGGTTCCPEVGKRRALRQLAAPAGEGSPGRSGRRSPPPERTCRAADGRREVALTPRARHLRPRLHPWSADLSGLPRDRDIPSGADGPCPTPLQRPSPRWRPLGPRPGWSPQAGRGSRDSPSSRSLQRPADGGRRH